MMGYGQILMNGLRTMLFDDKALSDNANDETASAFGFLTLAIAGIISCIIPFLTAGKISILSLILAPVIWIVGFIIGYSIFHFLANKFDGQASGEQYFRLLSNVFVIYWIVFWVSYIPVAGIVISRIIDLWLAITNAYILYKVHKLSMIAAIIIGAIIPIVIFIILWAVGALYLTSSIYHI